MPAFFAETKLPAAENTPARVGKLQVYRPRRPHKVDKSRRIEAGGPAHGWHKAWKDKIEEAKHADTEKAAHWYAMTPEGRVSLMLAAKPQRAAVALLGEHAAQSRAQAELAWVKHRAKHGPHGRANGHHDKAKPEAGPRGPTHKPDRPPAVNPPGHVLPKQAQALGNRGDKAVKAGAEPGKGRGRVQPTGGTPAKRPTEPGKARQGGNKAAMGANVGNKGKAKGMDKAKDKAKAKDKGMDKAKDKAKAKDKGKAK